MSKKILGREFAKALEAAGVVSDLNTIERIVIDVQAMQPVRIYVQRIGDEQLLPAAGILGMLLAENDPKPDGEAT